MQKRYGLGICFCIWKEGDDDVDIMEAEETAPMIDMDAAAEKNYKH